jgi:hypothetical protein
MQMSEYLYVVPETTRISHTKSIHPKWFFTFINETDFEVGPRSTLDLRTTYNVKF